MNAKKYLDGLLNENEDLSTIDFQKEFIDAGVAAKKGVTEDDVNPKELEMGIEVEMEHVSNKYLSKIIALSHLAEIPDYYTRLRKMEDEAKANSEEKRK